LETVIAEKLETFLIRGTANSRSKDFYDLYILHQMQRDCISLNILKKAFEQTCHYRHFAISKKEAIRLAESVRDNSLCQTRWKAYQKKANYSQGISFIDVIDAIIQWIEIALD
jgi:predicted nucleotidyltransferase component of viral defense system